MNPILKVAVYDFLSPFSCKLHSPQGPRLLFLTDFWPFSSKAVSQLIIFAHLSALSPFSLFLSTSPPSPTNFMLFLLWDGGCHNLIWEWWAFPTAVRLDPFYQEKWQARRPETRVWAWGQSGAGTSPGPLLTWTVFFCIPYHKGTEMVSVSPRALGPLRLTCLKIVRWLAYLLLPQTPKLWISPRSFSIRSFLSLSQPWPLSLVKRDYHNSMQRDKKRQKWTK